MCLICFIKHLFPPIYQSKIIPNRPKILFEERRQKAHRCIFTKVKSIGATPSVRLLYTGGRKRCQAVFVAIFQRAFSFFVHPHPAHLLRCKSTEAKCLRPSPIKGDGTNRGGFCLEFVSDFDTFGYLGFIWDWSFSFYCKPKY
jgi:hypothetical protein